MNKSFVAALLPIFLLGCAAQQQKSDMSAFKAAAPRSILVVPVVNKSLDVDAPNYVLATLPVPIAERGYYVFPVNTTKMILEQEGFYESEQVRQQSPQSLTQLFGADAVLFVTINRWDAQYALITTTVTVDFDYRLVFKDGTEIWKAQERMTYAPDNNNSGGSAAAQLVSALLKAALTRAAPNYMPMTKQVNNMVFISGPTALPNGPYKPSK